MRGIGSYTGQLISGNDADPVTVVYRTTWQGVVDFDAVTPTVDVTAKSAKLRRPARTYSIRTVLNAHEGPVSYSVDIRSGSLFLALKQGTTVSGRATITLRVRAPRSVRSVKVIVIVSDSVGNESTTTRSVKLR